MSSFLRPRPLLAVLLAGAILVSGAPGSSPAGGLGGEGRAETVVAGPRGWDGQPAVVRPQADTEVVAAGEPGGERVAGRISGGRRPTRGRPWSSVGIERDGVPAGRATSGWIRLRSPPSGVPA